MFKVSFLAFCETKVAFVISATSGQLTDLGSPPPLLLFPLIGSTFEEGFSSGSSNSPRGKSAKNNQIELVWCTTRATGKHKTAQEKERRVKKGRDNIKIIINYNFLIQLNGKGHPRLPGPMEGREGKRKERDQNGTSGVEGR